MQGGAARHYQIKSFTNQETRGGATGPASGVRKGENIATTAEGAWEIKEGLALYSRKKGKTEPPPFAFIPPLLAEEPPVDAEVPFAVGEGRREHKLDRWGDCRPTPWHRRAAGVQGRVLKAFRGL